jgi:hypothetical protein
LPPVAHPKARQVARLSRLCGDDPTSDTRLPGTGMAPVCDIV